MNQRLSLGLKASRVTSRPLNGGSGGWEVQLALANDFTGVDVYAICSST